MLPHWHRERAAAAYEDFEEIFETFADEEDLAERTADADVISATHHKSVALLGGDPRAALGLPAGLLRAGLRAFFHGALHRGEAVASYTALPDMLLFAKSHWLCNVVGERHGLFVAKVEPSIDRELFKPSGSGIGGSAIRPLRVVAMVRPRTARRQPLATIAVLESCWRSTPARCR